MTTNLKARLERLEQDLRAKTDAAIMRSHLEEHERRRSRLRVELYRTLPPQYMHDGFAHKFGSVPEI